MPAMAEALESHERGNELRTLDVEKEACAVRVDSRLSGSLEMDVSPQEKGVSVRIRMTNRSSILSQLRSMTAGLSTHDRPALNDHTRNRSVTGTTRRRLNFAVGVPSLFRQMTAPPTPIRAHVVAGGFPRGSSAGHDIDYARLRILELLQQDARTLTSVSGDFKDIGDWLPASELLVTYVAGPFPDDRQSQQIAEWLEGGGRWLALHGTSGGRAVPMPDGSPGRMMSRAPHHEVLGAFFMNHPPIRKFQVDVRDREHPLTRGLPASFDVMDELYLIELTAPAESHVLLTTSDLDVKDPAPRTFGFTYAEDTSVESDGRTRTVGYVRQHGAGAVAYFALGHCHTPSTNIQPFVDASVDAAGTTPLQFRGPWQTDAFERLLQNGIEWGLEAR
jgi:type 1 glutamine amidotransferase